ncbi:hypothetical protein Efla_006302 [Eimeria flavescens]
METATLTCRCINSKPPASVEALRFSPDGRWLAVGRSSGAVEIFSSVSRHLKLRLAEASCSSVRNILWVPLTVAAVEALTAGEGGKLLAQDGLNPSNAISLFEWRIVTAGLHGVVSAWNLRTCRVQVECPSYGGAIFSLCRSPLEVGLPAFAAACDDGRVRLFQLTGLAERAFREAKDDPYVGVLQAENEEEEEIRLLQTLPKTRARLLSVCWYSPDLVFAGNAASCILRFSRSGPQQAFAADGKMMLETQPAGAQSAEGAATLVWNLRALPRRSLLVSGDSRGRVTLWSLPACVALRSLQVHVADVLDLEVMECIDSFLGTQTDKHTPVVKMQQEVIFSVGVDGKISAISRTEGDRWVVGACRFPHLSDIQALACLPRIPGAATDASLVVTGAADGSIKYMQQLTELAGLKAPCLPFCSSPALQGLQKPRVLWKKRLFVCPSADDVGIWHLEESALSRQQAAESTEAASPPLIRLARITLQSDLKIKCCDATRDGHLVAVGSSQGLHLFGVHLKELEIQDLECVGACCISESVTALQFVSRSVLACCHFAKKQRKGANCRRLLQLAECASASAAPSAEGKRGKGRQDSRSALNATEQQTTQWEYTEVSSLREAEALPKSLLKDGGSFSLSFLKVSTGQEIASFIGLPFPIVSMTLSADAGKLACLNSNGSILVVDVKSFEATHFLPNTFRRGESVATFCFSPDAASLFVLGTRNGFYVTAVDKPEEIDEQEANRQQEGEATETESARKRQKRRSQRNIRAIPARQLSRGDGCILDAKWIVAADKESYVLCLTPSSLFKIRIVDAEEEGDISSNSKKKQRREGIRLLDLSSASEDERPGDQPTSPLRQSFPRSRKRLPLRRPVVIGPSPVHAAAFCVPRVLPPSLSSRQQGDSSFSWTSLASDPSPCGTASTRSTATTPGDSPVSDSRLNGEAGRQQNANAGGAFRALRRSENKGFIGFALESCAGLPTETGLSDAAVHQALILLEAFNSREASEQPLPHFSRKRYGT